MKQVLLLIPLFALGSSIAGATTLCVNDDTLQNYINNYSTAETACQIGDKLFYNFQLVNNNGNTNGPAATNIQVQDLPFDGVSNIGVNFNTGGWVISNGGTVDQSISYNVLTVSNQPLIKDLTLIITASLTSGTGSVTVTESVNPAVSKPLTANVGTQLVHTDFSPNYQTALAVTDHILVVGGSTATSYAHLSSIENDFSEVAPEPLGTVLIGSGLLILGLVRRRSSRRG
jgi:hypothetical protein